MAQPYSCVLLIRSNGQDIITVFSSLSIAYDAVRKSVKGVEDIYLEDYSHIANELCERACIAESIPLPVAWNRTKSWIAYLCRSRIYTDSNCYYPPPGSYDS